MKTIYLPDVESNEFYSLAETLAEKITDDLFDADLENIPVPSYVLRAVLRRLLKDNTNSTYTAKEKFIDENTSNYPGGVIEKEIHDLCTGETFIITEPARRKEAR